MYTYNAMTSPVKPVSNNVIKVKQKKVALSVLPGLFSEPIQIHKFKNKSSIEKPKQVSGNNNDVKSNHKIKPSTHFKESKRENKPSTKEKISFSTEKFHLGSENNEKKSLQKQKERSSSNVGKTKSKHSSEKNSKPDFIRKSNKSMQVKKSNHLFKKKTEPTTLKHQKVVDTTPSLSPNSSSETIASEIEKAQENFETDGKVDFNTSPDSILSANKETTPSMSSSINTETSNSASSDYVNSSIPKPIDVEMTLNNFVCDVQNASVFSETNKTSFTADLDMNKKIEPHQITIAFTDKEEVIVSEPTTIDPSNLHATLLPVSSLNKENSIDSDILDTDYDAEHNEFKSEESVKKDKDISLLKEDDTKTVLEKKLSDSREIKHKHKKHKHDRENKLDFFIAHKHKHKKHKREKHKISDKKIKKEHDFYSPLDLNSDISIKKEMDG